ncbi:Flagellar biosynthesis protein, FliO [compost metagenome]
MRRSGKNKAAPGAWLTGWQRLAKNTASPDIRRIASTRLTPRHSLHVIEWNGRQLLLGCTEQSMQLLSEAVVTPAQQEERPS